MAATKDKVQHVRTPKGKSPRQLAKRDANIKAAQERLAKLQEQQKAQKAAKDQIVAERLLNDHSPPGTSFVCGQARRSQLFDHSGEEARGDRQIERMVAVGATDSVEVTEDFREFRVGFIGIKIAGHETHAAGKLFPDVLAEWCAGVFPDGVFSDLGEVLISPVPAGEADEGKRRGQEAPVREVVDRRKQLLARQVAGNAEENQSTRSGDSWQASVVGVAQWIR